MIAKELESTVPHKLSQAFRGRNDVPIMSRPGPNSSMLWRQHRVRCGLLEQAMEGL